MSDTAFEALPYGGPVRFKPRLAWLAAVNPFAFARTDEPLDRRRRLPSRLGRRITAVAIQAAAAVALFAGGATILVAALHRPPAPPTAATTAPAPAWRDIVKPVQIYNLEAPEFTGAVRGYSARRHTVGGGREDVLTLGTIGGDKPGLRLRVFRRTAEALARPPLFAALVHEAAQSGLAVGRSGLPDLMPTRFGRFEVADLSLVHRDGAEAPCAGFRLLLDKPALSITGLVCGRHAMRLSHADVGCLVERLDVSSARDDRELIDFFAASELHRNAACTGMRLGPDGRHAPWLDDKPAPAVATDKPVTSRKRLRHR